MTNDKRILLEDIQKAVGCAYLSDLYLTAGKYEKEINRFIQNIDEMDYEFEEWIRTVQYIFNPSKEVHSIEEARQILIGKS